MSSKQSEKRQKERKAILSGKIKIPKLPDLGAFRIIHGLGVQIVSVTISGTKTYFFLHLNNYNFSFLGY